MLKELRVMNLQQNQLTGHIPTRFCYLAQLKELCLGDNALTGAIPPPIGALGMLEVLSLEQNKLSGMLPAEIGLLRRLRELRLHENCIGGKLPTDEWKELHSLEEFELFPNRVECTQRTVDSFHALLQAGGAHAAAHTETGL